MLGCAEEATHQGERVEAVSGEHLVIRGRVGYYSVPAYPVELGHSRQVSHHLAPIGDQDPAVQLVSERMGPQPAPDAGVPIDLVGLGVVGVDERAQFIYPALEIGTLQRPYRYLRRSGRDRLRYFSFFSLGARLLPGCAAYRSVSRDRV